MISIKYQTSDLVPAPYAFAAQLDLIKKSNSLLSYNLEISYLDRESLSEEEIFEEGFTLNDDLKLEGNLPVIWSDELELIKGKTEKTNKTEIDETEDLWIISYDNHEFYPKNPRQWLGFFEEIRQAILEQNKIENSLKITLVEVIGSTRSSKIYHGSFEHRTLVEEGKETKSLKWSQLAYLLKDIYSGEFIYETALDKIKNNHGIYLNLGDEYWFELGKSYLNSPQKVKKWL